MNIKEQLVQECVNIMKRQDIKEDIYIIFLYNGIITISRRIE